MLIIIKLTYKYNSTMGTKLISGYQSDLKDTRGNLML